MQEDNARTIDDQVVPDEEAKLLLAYYMERTISKEVYQKKQRELLEKQEIRYNAAVRTHTKKRPGQMPRRYKKEIYVKKLYGFDVITGYCVSVSEIWKTFEKSVKGNG